MGDYNRATAVVAPPDSRAEKLKHALVSVDLLSQTGEARTGISWQVYAVRRLGRRIRLSSCVRHSLAVVGFSEEAADSRRLLAASSLQARKTTSGAPLSSPANGLPACLPAYLLACLPSSPARVVQQRASER